MPEINVSLSEIERAQQVLRKLLKPTPLLWNGWLSARLGCSVFLKLENMQPIGSFKIRGATYKISKLTSQQKRRGVITASAGNHAQGVAWGCLQYKTRATIVMPVNAPLTKVENTKALGAKVVLQGESYDEANKYAETQARKTGQIFVHPYDDDAVIAGQGTIGLEILDQLPDVDVIIGSMGGGGLMGGIGYVMKELSKKTTIIGAQASGAKSLLESIKKGKVFSTNKADTFADGIKVKMPRKRMVHHLEKVLDGLGEADDEEIAAAVLMLMEKSKIVAEGAGALPLAVLDKKCRQYRGKKVVLIVSGGNIDVNVLSRIIDRGLIKTGRRVRLNAYVIDRPGTLKAITSIIAERGANIIQAIHDRDAPMVGLNQTNVELTLETRGQTHSNEIIEVLKKYVYKLEVLH